MALSPLLGQVMGSPTVTDYAADAAKTQMAQRLGAAQLGQAAVQAQSAQQDLAAKRRGMAVSMLNGIAQEQDPGKQAALYATLKPMAERYDPTLKLPDAYDPALGKALVTSQMKPADLAELALKQRTVDIEQQKADQGNFEPVKDMYGAVTGFVNKKSGSLLDNPQAAAAAVPPTAADGSPLTGADYLQTLPPSHAAVVKAIGEGRVAAPTGYALTKPLGQKLMQDVQLAYPDFNGNVFGASKEFNTGKLGSTVRSLNVANDHLDTLSQYVTALNNGDTKAVNALANTFKDQFGRPAPATFDAVKGIVGDEVAKAVLGSGGALSDREELKAGLSKAGSPEQLAGVIDGYKALMRGQIGGLQRQYEQSTNKKDFLDKLSPQTKKEILGETGQPTGPKVGTIMNGFVFTGGDPKNQASWKPAQ